MTTNEICVFHRACSEGAEKDTPRSRPQARSGSSVQAPSNGRSRQQKETMIKIAYITDIHLDPKYSPVGVSAEI